MSIHVHVLTIFILITNEGGKKLMGTLQKKKLRGIPKRKKYFIEGV